MEKKKRKRRKKKRIKRDPTLYAKESHAIRISPELNSELLKLRRRLESYDNIIRRLLGMPVSKYKEYTAKIMFAIDDGTHLFEDEAVARGEAIRLAVKSGKKPSPILRIRTAC